MKTEALVNAVIVPHSVDIALKTLGDIPSCGVSTDGSHHGAVKIFPLLIQYFDWNNDGVQIKLVEVKNTPNESAETFMPI